MMGSETASIAPKETAAWRLSAAASGSRPVTAVVEMTPAVKTASRVPSRVMTKVSSASEASGR
ncbi:hypothetical protein A5N15_08600 [Rothia kristinae]|uniref:Uncharacterized protein n=1 Tax=Rothia kristinae TaxID=37923 RepID=A0A657IU63_9MICC|nr:hypothetical protein A5N15_08600 [Rothia kristinae]